MNRPEGKVDIGLVRALITRSGILGARAFWEAVVLHRKASRLIAQSAILVPGFPVEHHQGDPGPTSNPPLSNMG